MKRSAPNTVSPLPTSPASGSRVSAAVERALDDRQREATEEVERILAAAVRVMERVAPEPPRVSDIVTEAGSSNKAFYRYFAGKDDVILAVMERGVAIVVSYLQHQMTKERKPAGQVRRWIEDFGRDRVCLALDVRPKDQAFEVAVHGWTQGAGVMLDAALDRYPDTIARHVLVTDVSRDGALTGPNLALIKRLAARRPELQVQASGGVATLEDLPALKAAGAAGAIVGRALYEGRFTLQEALRAG